MKPRSIALALPLALWLAAAARADDGYDGTWKIVFDGKVAVDIEGTVVVKGSEGTWNVVTRSRRNPCVGREYPITVKKATAEDLVFEVERARTLQGCRNTTYSFKRIDAKTLQGEVGEGRTSLLKLQ